MNGRNEIMPNLPNCPQCNSAYTYEDQHSLVCPECAHEWHAESEVESAEDEKVATDAHGNILNDGDAVTLVKDLKIKGSSSVVKSEEHTSELQSRGHLVCRLLLEKKKKK